MSASLRIKKNHSHSAYDLSNLEWVCDTCGKPILQNRWGANPRVHYCTCNLKKIDWSKIKLNHFKAK
jgi:RNA polymerase-binding transcription factor DksA